MYYDLAKAKKAKGRKKKLRQIPYEGSRCKTFVLPQFCASFDVVSCRVLPESGVVGTPAKALFTLKRAERLQMTQQ